MDYGLMSTVRRRFPWTLISVWFEIYLCGDPPLNSPSALRAAVDGILRSGGLKSHQDFWRRLRVTLWGLTADPWTACGVDASVSSICVIRTNIIKCLAWIHLSIWCKRWKHDTFILPTPLAWQNPKFDLTSSGFTCLLWTDGVKSLLSDILVNTWQSEISLIWRAD